MRIALLFTFIALLAPLSASAHSARFVDVAQNEITTISTPEISQAYYGELKNSPHMFEVVSTQALPLNVQILVPAIESGKTNVSGLIIKVIDRGVEEISRMSSKDAEWEKMREHFVGDTYLEGPEFEEMLPPGTYRIEVSSPDNLGKYVLVVGKEEVISVGDYFHLVGDIVKIKKFFEKPFIAVLQSPLVSVPLFLVMIFGWFCYRKYKKRNIA